MVLNKKGSVIDSRYFTIVNPVNTLGVSGAGLAKAFKIRYPDNYTHYKEYCEKGKLKPGELFCFESGERRIINLATKKEWWFPSKLIWVENGLKEIKKYCWDNNISEIALPYIGCGKGGLNAKVVRELISKQFENDSLHVNLYVYIK